MSLFREPQNNIPHMPEPRESSELGQQFYAARNLLGLDVEQLAYRASVPPLAVKMWETGPECLKSLPAILRVLRRDLIVTKGGFSLGKLRQWVSR